MDARIADGDEIAFLPARFGRLIRSCSTSCTPSRSGYDKLMGLIADPAIQADQQEYRRHTRSLSEIQPLVEQFREYKAVVEELAETRASSPRETTTT